MEVDMTLTGPVSIVVADGHQIVCEGIAMLCESDPNVRIVGRCWDGIAALEMIQFLKPAVAILDLNLPELQGIEVIRQLRQNSIPTKLIVLSITRDATMVQNAFRSGANGFLLKDEPYSHLLAAIQQTLEGGIYISPLLPAIQLFPTSRRDRSGDDPLDILSARERQVMGLLVEGLRAKDIAYRLQISPKTVDGYRASMMRKLSIANFAGLVKFSIKQESGSRSFVAIT
jgi:DNA-binding NarL/FixJ family response regulator